jgi:hypothetical protein
MLLGIKKVLVLLVQALQAEVEVDIHIVHPIKMRLPKVQITIIGVEILEEMKVV